MGERQGVPTSSALLHNLRLLNRKERFYLVNAALGGFEICETFKEQLRRALGESVSIDWSRCEFAAMDYHFDWLYAAIFASSEAIDLNAVSEKGHHIPVQTWSRQGGLISATQEDIDLLVAFRDNQDEEKTHLILIEAKGVGSWGTKQIRSKGMRVSNLLRERDVCRKAGVILYFLYASPAAPTQASLDGIEDLPDIMKLANKHVWIDVGTNLVKVTQCDIAGQPQQRGPHWKFERTPCRGGTR